MTKHKKQTPVNVEYNGIMSEYQLTGNTLDGKKVGLVVHNPMNNYQNFLYNRVMFGLSVYTQELIQRLPESRM